MMPQSTFLNWEPFSKRIVLPTILTIILFISAIFFIIIPAIEKNSMDHKREMIRELTNSAWNILAKLHDDEQKGLLTREQAQRQAIEQITNLHYGQAVKDYFWINDMHPRMVIHPYRTDLNGKDLSHYTDPDGTRVFVEFVSIVKQHGSGFVNYKWQSYDNKNLILPKLSYVKGFEPWGWIIGTGIYLEDIRSEIAVMTGKVIKISLGIFLLISLLFTSIIRQSYKTQMQQRKAEEDLKKTQTSLALAEKMASLGKLSAMVAHEINNPLSGILSYAKLSSKYLQQEEIDSKTIETLRENLTLIAGEAKRCGDIVKNLLLFAKRSLGEIKEVHLNEIIEVSIKVVDHSARIKDMDLVMDLDSGNDVIQCDAGAIQQIFIALIINAIESSPPGEKIIVRTDYRNKDFIIIKLIDYGDGISEDVLPHIFEPFFSTKTSNKSLGLGLATVYGIVKRHAGTINVESRVGKGTEFTITLPRLQELSPLEDKKGAV